MRLGIRRIAAIVPRRFSPGLPGSLPLALAFAASAAATLTTHGRDYRVLQYPNGVNLGCTACHVNASGTGTLTGFGQDVLAITGAENRPFWSRDLALKDSDGDHYQNGIEVGDPDGDGASIPGYRVSNPGDPNSLPPVNQGPQFSSFPVVQASIGLPYSYQAQASDPEGDLLSFTKSSGPEWLSVSASGAVTGTPPEGAAGKYFVGVRATDDGLPPRTANQLYELTVTASYAGWQLLRFALPAEAELAAPLADPDGDGLANLGEYALGRNPRLADAPPLLLPTVSAQGLARFTLVIRDDDPSLKTQIHASNDASYTDGVAIPRVITDPVPADGLLTLTFSDPTPLTDSAAPRFWRIQFRLTP